MSLSVYAKNKLHKNQENDAWTKLYELVPDGSKVLDVGCSTGNFGAQLIKTKNCTVTGIDLNRDDLAVASRQLTHSALKNIERDAIDDLGTFDVILMADVIEHLIDPTAALVKLKKQLTKGGILVFSVPNMANIANRLELLKGRFSYTEYGLLDETHLHYYDRIELEKVLYNAGFTVREYNNSIRDIPRPAAENLLAEIGLMPNEIFWKAASHIDATSFQFIGIAEVAKAKHATRGSKTPYDFVSREFDVMRAAHSKEVGALMREHGRQAADAQETISNLEEELQTIKNSKGWRYMQKIQSIRSKLSRS